MITFKSRCRQLEDGKNQTKFFALTVGKDFIEGASDKFRKSLNEKYYRIHIAKKSAKQLPPDCGRYIDIVADEKDCFLSDKDSHPTIVVRNAKEILRK